jgi:hypothetical protein
MKAIIALVLQYPANDWATEYGTTDTDASTDFDAALRRAVHESGITETLNRAWPMMRGHISAHLIDGLDATTRDELLRLLQEARDADQDRALFTDITNHLAAHQHLLDGREPRWVVFHNQEWDSGYFLTGSDARVYFADGDSTPMSFTGTSVDDRLTDMYGARGPMAALGVDLHEGTVEFDDYGDNVPNLLRIPASAHSAGDGCAIYDTDHMVERDGVTVSITDIRTGEVFIDFDQKPWLAAGVGRDGHDVHVDIATPEQA